MVDYIEKLHDSFIYHPHPYIATNVTMNMNINYMTIQPTKVVIACCMIIIIKEFNHYVYSMKHALVIVR